MRDVGSKCPAHDVLVNFLILTSFFIFIHFLPIAAESQPLFTLMVAFLLLSLSFSMKRKVSISSIVLFLLCCYLFVYSLVCYFSGAGFIVFFDLAKILVGPIIYFSIKGSLDRVNNLSLAPVVVLLNVLIVFVFINKDAVLHLHEIITGRENTHGRPNFLTPEPSYYTYIFCIGILVTWHVYLANKISKSVRNYYFLIFFSCGVMTASSYQYIFLVFFLVSIFVAIRRYKAFAFLLAALLLGFSLSFHGVGDGRIINLIKTLMGFVSNEVSFNYLIYNADPSASARVILNTIAFYSSFDNLGFGALGVPFLDSWREIAYFLNFDLSSHEVLRTLKVSEAQTYAANLAYSYGAYALLGYAVFVFFVFRSGFGKLKNMGSEKSGYKGFLLFSIFCVVFFSLFQGAVTVPSLWIALSLVASEGGRR